MTEPGRELFRAVLERHGFGAFIALILLAVLFGFVPSPLTSLAKHVERDAQREAVLLSICLNTSRDADERARCWVALLEGRVPQGGK